MRLCDYVHTYYLRIRKSFVKKNSNKMVAKITKLFIFAFFLTNFVESKILYIEPELGDVVDVAIAAGSFTTLVKLLSDLGLEDALRNATAQTIFAPSDEAFAKLPEGTLESLTTEQATAIVLRHVVGGATVLAADVITGPVETLGGETIDLIKTGPGILIAYENNLINVVTTDVMASNGVIHVIDGVILPGAPTTTTTKPITTSVASMPQSTWALLIVMVSLMSLIV